VLAPADARPEHAARRNITLSPRHGTRVVLDGRARDPELPREQVAASS
jgi:hypothetical protein